MDNLKKFKPLIYELIEFYVKELDNPNGGNYHILLYDGNIENIWDCQQWAEENGDTFGIFLGRILRMYSQEQLEEMYEDGWGGIL